MPPTPSPTATPVPADPTLGEQLRKSGDFEAAAAVYRAVSEQASGREQQDARLAQAQLLVRTGRQAEARPVLEAWLAAQGAGADASTARFLLASVLDDLGDGAAAIDGYGRYIDAGGVLTPYARIERAKLLARAGNTAAAQVDAGLVLAGDLLPDVKDSFTLSMARASEQGGDDPAALRWYAAASAASPATSLAGAGAIKRRLGDPSWLADYTQALTQYPDRGAPADLLAALDSVGAPVSDFTRGFVLYRAFRNPDARAAFERAISASDRPADSTYYLAALDERAGDNVAAIAGYRRVAALDPASALAPEALWWAGRLLAQGGRYSEAGGVFAQLAAAYPASPRRPDAAFQRGLVLYRSGDPSGAAAAWAAVADVSTGEEQQRARFWQGKALLEEKDPLGAPVLRQLAATTPRRYYALRAEVLLGANDTRKRNETLKDQPTDWDAIAAYLAANMGADPRGAVVATDPRWRMASELRAVALRPQADALERAALDAESRDHIRLFDTIRTATAAGETSLAARAAAALLALLPETAPPPPTDLQRLAYPPAYKDLATDAAGQSSVSPLLLMSLVRQESYFDPDAGSGAGALGLTQVVPSTGEAIASGLGVSAFTASDLYRPKLSLRFGASYLGDQLRSFDANPYQALAAYNGGPGTASNAITSSGGDDDLFVEDLEFDETKTYVRLVMQNYAYYRQLYLGLDRPSLPR
ncbi:MAG: transglycosylase SLT domain-containing protein [Chloroflexi bacterium]|nr:transglycosylase SLT domain-containing protein [Chloroflexota bacterium]